MMRPIVFGLLARIGREDEGWAGPIDNPLQDNEWAQKDITEKTAELTSD